VLTGNVSKVSLLPPDRRRDLVRAALQTRNLEGDMAEVGVYQGGSARALSLALPGKRLHLFDTFTGLPSGEIGGHQQGEFACSLAEVLEQVNYPNVTIHAGVFPASAVGLEEVRFSFVHLDGDLYTTTRDALAWFWPRLVPGGAIVLDDWQWQNCPG